MDDMSNCIDVQSLNCHCIRAFSKKTLTITRALREATEIIGLSPKEKKTLSQMLRKVNFKIDG